MSEVTVGRDFLGAIGAQETAFEIRLWGWVATYNGESDLDVLDPFGEVMLTLDRFIGCEWGCDGDHPEKHLVASSVSHIRAIAVLVFRGYFGEACALFRALGENVNLMALLMTSSDAEKDCRDGNKGQRRDKFSASKVEYALVKKGTPVPLTGRSFGLLSEYYLHSNTLDHIFSYRTSQEDGEITLPDFHRDLCMGLLMNLIGAANTALILRAGSLEDYNDVRLAYALADRAARGMKSFSAKMAEDPTVKYVVPLNYSTNPWV